MKKIYFTLIISMISQLLFSQSIGIFQNGIELTQKSITIYGTSDEEELEIQEIVVVNSSPTPKDIRVKRYEISYVPNTYNFICWGVCEAPFNHKGGKDPFYILNTTVNVTNSYLGFSGHYLPQGTKGSSEYRYVFYDLKKPTDSSWFNVIYSTNLTSNSEIQAENNLEIYPNPVQDVVKFQIHNNETINDWIDIFDITGRKITSLPCQNIGNGLNLAEWNLIDNTNNAVANGIYVCKSRLSKQAFPRKIVVER